MIEPEILSWRAGKQWGWLASRPRWNAAVRDADPRGRGAVHRIPGERPVLLADLCKRCLTIYSQNGVPA